MEKDNRCNLCNKIYGSKSHLNRHIKARHESLNHKLNHECDKCDKKFCKKESLANHEERVYSEQGNDFICDYCQKPFLSAKGLLYHVKRVHLNEENFQCDKCETSFSEKYKFNRHVNELHNPWLKELMTKCGVCNKTIKKKYIEDSHEKPHQKT